MNAAKHSSSPPGSTRPLKQLRADATRGEFTVKQDCDIMWRRGGVSAKLVQTGCTYAFVLCDVPAERHAVLAATPFRV